MPIDSVSVLHLRYLLAVAEHGTVTGAARALGVAQPSVSQQMRQLEWNTGLRLFDRSAHGMALTAQGSALVAAAAQWLDALAQVTGGPGQARVGIPRGIGATELDRIRAVLGPDVVFRRCDSVAAERALARGELEAAVVREALPSRSAPAPEGELVRHPLGALLSARASVLDNGAPPTCLVHLQGCDLAWFREDRAPAFARVVLDAVAASGWTPRRVVIDPATAAIVQDALAHRPGLVMLRPEPEVLPPGLVWLPLDDAPWERLRLAIGRDGAAPAPTKDRPEPSRAPGGGPGSSAGGPSRRC